MASLLVPMELELEARRPARAGRAWAAAMARARLDRATARSKEIFPFLWKQWKPWHGLTTLSLRLIIFELARAGPGAA